MAQNTMYERLDNSAVVIRIQYAIDHLMVERKQTTDGERLKGLGYMLRGLIQAKQMIEEGRK